MSSDNCVEVLLWKGREGAEMWRGGGKGVDCERGRTGGEVDWKVPVRE